MRATDLIKAIEDKLSSKTSWGRNEVISAIKDVLLTEVFIQKPKQPTARIIDNEPEFRLWLLERGWDDLTNIDLMDNYFKSQHKRVHFDGQGGFWFE